MKKKITSVFLVFAMCLSLCVPAFASAPKNTETMPPWVKEGETWFPANGIMPLEDDTCRYGHYAPKGYLYRGYTTGNSMIEGFASGAALSLMGLIPGLGTIMFSVTTIAAGANMVYAIQHNGRVQGKYYKSVYVSPSGNVTWYHITWVYNDAGVERWLDCSEKTETAF